MILLFSSVFVPSSHYIKQIFLNSWNNSDESDITGTVTHCVCFLLQYYKKKYKRFQTFFFLCDRSNHLCQTSCNRERKQWRFTYTCWFWNKTYVRSERKHVIKFISKFCQIIKNWVFLFNKWQVKRGALECVYCQNQEVKRNIVYNTVDTVTKI